MTHMYLIIESLYFIKRLFKNQIILILQTDTCMFPNNRWFSTRWM